VFERRGDRVIVLLSSGNLAGTHAVIGVLNQRCASTKWGKRRYLAMETLLYPLPEEAAA
jgi:predicted proteasome-type protease